MKIGETIIYNGNPFTVTDIKQEEDVKGSVIFIRAVDPETATNEQTKAISSDQTKEYLLGLIKKMGGGE